MILRFKKISNRKKAQSVAVGIRIITETLISVRVLCNNLILKKNTISKKSSFPLAAQQLSSVSLSLNGVSISL